MTPDGVDTPGASLDVPANRSCFDCDADCSGHPWCSVTYGVTLCLQCAGAHRALGVQMSFVRSITLDTLTPREHRSLTLGGNEAFATFLAAEARGVSRRVWLALPIETRYFTPAADLYRRQLAAKLDAAEAEGGALLARAPQVLDATIRPPPPSAEELDRAARVKWTADREAPRCELCKADFHLLNWRHHCRKCGRCICADCSPDVSWRPLPALLGHSEPTRHCKLCVTPTRLIPGMGPEGAVEP
jgi:hypothetical protein